MNESEEEKKAKVLSLDLLKGRRASSFDSEYMNYNIGKMDFSTIDEQEYKDKISASKQQIQKQESQVSEGDLIGVAGKK